MSFSLKRGRPRVSRPRIDTGTAELAARHAKGLTMEVLDSCLKSRLIANEEHAAGMHLRWLYSLRFGSPTVRAYMPDDARGRNITKHDEQWRRCRESEYEKAIQALKAIDAHIMVTNIVIFNRVPRFLQPMKITALSVRMAALQEMRTRELVLFQEGLRLLVSLFMAMRDKRA